ncbi:MAG: hypothetical protein BWY96_02531 [Spirochaetes bacterium ADurb.BinA120]|nr:MAG: hypothetical protein BWY96_02531 [Spirochaetes bacterium ADurb.BinA120]
MPRGLYKRREIAIQRRREMICRFDLDEGIAGDGGKIQIQTVIDTGRGPRLEAVALAQKRGVTVFYVWNEPLCVVNVESVTHGGSGDTGRGGAHDVDVEIVSIVEILKEGQADAPDEGHPDPLVQLEEGPLVASGGFKDRLNVLESVFLFQAVDAVLHRVSVVNS